jgi:long-subunit acyl-CoA synthetase (AMP-forming)
VLQQTGAQALFCADSASAAALGFTIQAPYHGSLVLCESSVVANVPSLDGVQKITFTSGTTASPKGVCLSSDQQWEVARALRQGVETLALERHLCLLPFAVLLENIAGPYTALLSGATTICPPLAETGLAGASQFDPHRCIAAIEKYQAHSIILLPQMLQAIVMASTDHDPRLSSLRFVAVGGARTPPQLLAAAQARGIPVFEGYGLSECASVVALNLPGAQHSGSVGRPLSHRQVRIASDGEIEVSGNHAHYLGAKSTPSEWLPTGDLGHRDADGFLYIDGRKKDILITGFGRNVSPEWPEALLLGSGVIAQALVVGDSMPYLSALIVPAMASISPALLQQAVDHANNALPDYAQIRRWAAVPAFTPANGEATANGRPRRAAIQERHTKLIASLYVTEQTQ